MPASSRLLDLFGIGSPLRRTVPYLPESVPEAGWREIWANGMWGGYLTATADAARVRVDLYWPGIRKARIYRVHADGTEYLVRGGDPATMCTAWARWDYEIPHDQAIYYRAESDEREGSHVVTAPVTVSSSTQAWLKHPTKPGLNRIITIRSLNQRQRTNRRGVLRPPLRKYPIVVHGVTTAHVGSLVLQTDGTAELDAINEIFDDGSDLLLVLPTVWGGHHWYISVTNSGEDRLEPMLGTLLMEHVGLAFEVVDRPPGAAEGGEDNTYADLGEAYQTYNQLAPAHSSYLELSMASF